MAEEKVAAMVKPKQDDQKNGNAELTELERDIIRQVEYYFGDINYGRDKFMQEEAKKNEGWLTAEIMLRFNRLKKICDNPETIAKAVSKSDEGLVEVQHNGPENIAFRRSLERPIISDDLSFWKSVRERSVYVKPFPLDATLDEIESTMRPLGDLQNITMRRTRAGDHVFTGKIYASFANKEQCEAVVALSKDGKLKMMREVDGEPVEIELVAELQLAHAERKAAERRAAREKQKAEKALANPLLAKRQAKEAARAEATTFHPGLVLQLSEVPDSVEYQALKELFGGRDKVAFVEHKKGETEAFVRLTPAAPASTSAKKEETNGDVKKEDTTDADETKENAKVTRAEECARAACNADGKLILNDHEIKWRVVDGDEEKEFWNRFTKSRAERDAAHKGGRGGGRQTRGSNNQGPQARADKRKSAAAAQTGHTVPKSQGERKVFADSDNEDDEGADKKNGEPSQKKAKTEKSEANGDAAVVKAEA